MPRHVKSAALRPRAGFLPAEVDSFVGRRRELDEVRRLFTGSPLVTIVGPGGVGKTRLALRAAANLARSFRDGVWLCELGEIQDRALVTQAVADALGGAEPPAALTEQSLARMVSGSHLLLVLDNCEHVLEEAASLAYEVLRSAPDVRIIATSREPLGIPGEAPMRLQPLVVPRAPAETTAQSLPRYDAAQLFLDRAATASADFVLTDENSSDVARICEQLDGIPLAIELAAARVRTLAPRQLAERLSDLFALLTSGSRVAPPRHKTLRHCIDWSYEQCSEDEQLLWSRLSVFVGSFDLDAVEGICGFDGLDRIDLLDLIGSLVDKSIVTREMREGGPRFKLLDSLRAYGEEQLIASAEAATMRRRHADWCHQVVRDLEPDLFSGKQPSAGARLDAELSNLREALDFSLGKGGYAEAALRSINGLYVYWISRGLLTEARYWMGRALAHDDVGTSEDRVVGLYLTVAFAGLQGDVDAAREATAAVRLTQDLDDLQRQAFEASVDGLLAIFEGEPDQAMRHLPRASDAHRRRGDPLREVELLVVQGLALAVSGDETGAAEVHGRVLAITAPRGEIWWRANSLWAMGVAAWRHGHGDRAQATLEDSLRLRRSMDDSLGSVWSLVALALVHAESGQFERAAVLLGATSSLTRAAGAPPSIFPELAESLSNCQTQTAQALGESKFKKAQQRGQAMNVAEAAAFALADAPTPPREPLAGPSVLTRREREVAGLVARGLTNREIAAKLVISERTAEGHVENILTKLGYHSRTHVAAWVAEQRQGESSSQGLAQDELG